MTAQPTLATFLTGTPTRKSTNLAVNSTESALCHHVRSYEALLVNLWAVTREQVARHEARRALAARN